MPEQRTLELQHGVCNPEFALQAQPAAPANEVAHRNQQPDQSGRAIRAGGTDDPPGHAVGEEKGVFADEVDRLRGAQPRGEHVEDPRCFFAGHRGDEVAETAVELGWPGGRRSAPHRIDPGLRRTQDPHAQLPRRVVFANQIAGLPGNLAEQIVVVAQRKARLVAQDFGDDGVACSDEYPRRLAVEFERREARERRGTGLEQGEPGFVKIGFHAHVGSSPTPAKRRKRSSNGPSPNAARRAARTARSAMCAGSGAQPDAARTSSRSTSA